jgi:hypothetical protein
VAVENGRVQVRSGGLDVLSENRQVSRTWTMERLKLSKSGRRRVHAQVPRSWDEALRRQQIGNYGLVGILRGIYFQAISYDRLSSIHIYMLLSRVEVARVDFFGGDWSGLFMSPSKVRRVSEGEEKSYPRLRFGFGRSRLSRNPGLMNNPGWEGEEGGCSRTALATSRRLLRLRIARAYFFHGARLGGGILGCCCVVFRPDAKRRPAQVS